MNSTTHLNQRLVAAGGVALASGWRAAAGTNATAVDRDRHHLTVIAPMPSTYVVKPSFIEGATRRPTEGSS